MNENIQSSVSDLIIPANTALLPTADLAFIFGNKKIISELALAASRVYRNGHVRKILAAGGVEVMSGRTEAEMLRRELIAHGVPSRNILVENASRNTEENIKLGKQVIDAALGLENISTVIGVGHAAAGPRFIMSLSRHWPSALPMHISVFPKDVDPAKWWEDKAFLKKAFNDKAKLPLYQSLNYINPVLPHDINRLLTEHSDLGQILQLEAS